MDFHHYSKKLRVDEDAENFDSNNLNYDDDDDDFDEKLIVEVKSRPCLYTKNSDSLVVTKAWRDVGEALDTCVDRCQTRWKRLKQYFCKERQKRDLARELGITPKTKFKLYEKMFFMDAHIYRRKTVHKKQKSSGVLSNKTCAAETSTNGDQKEFGEEQNVVENLCTLEEQDVQNQCTLDLNPSQGSNEVAISQSTSDNITEEVTMETEPFYNDDGRDNSSRDVNDQPLTVVQKVHDTYSSKFSTISSGQLLPTGTPSNVPKLDSQLQSLVQNKFQDTISKLDHLGSKSTKNTAEPNEENSAIAKLTTAKLRKIDQSKKNEFKFGCMKILYNNID